MTTFQVECRSTPPSGSAGSALSEVILPKSLHGSFPSLVLIDPRQDQHCQRWSFQSLHRSFPSWVSIDPTSPPQDPHCQRRSFHLRNWQILSKLSVDRPPSRIPIPPHLRNDNFQSLSVDRPPSLPPHLRNDNLKLSVDRPPSPPHPLPPHLRNDNFQSLSVGSTFHPQHPLPSPPSPPKKSTDPFQVECWSTPLPSPPLPPHLRNDNFQVECQSTPPSVSIRGRSTVFEQNSSHSNQTTRCASQRTFPYGKVQSEVFVHVTQAGMFVTSCSYRFNSRTLLCQWSSLILCQIACARNAIVFSSNV